MMFFAYLLTNSSILLFLSARDLETLGETSLSRMLLFQMIGFAFSCMFIFIKQITYNAYASIKKSNTLPTNFQTQFSKGIFMLPSDKMTINLYLQSACVYFSINLISQDKFQAFVICYKVICQIVLMMEMRNKTVYYYDEMIGTYSYGQDHPLKPIRVTMTDQLIKMYGIHRHLSPIDNGFVDLYKKYTLEETLTTFHTDEYVDFIKRATPMNQKKFKEKLQDFNFTSGDCPLMDNLYDYVSSYTTGSVANAAILASQKAQFAINWSGGLHHAKPQKAMGFCYINDCVLAIMELLKTYDRVLYVDIDIHHGDGVEEAFYLTDRVMTCSFHKFKNFFPGTGDLHNTGIQKGIFHSVNFPLDQGLDDDSFRFIFQRVINKIMIHFNPSAIVLQGGTDSLSGDRLGCFNLSVKGHSFAAQFLKSFNKPILFLGGGGYTLRNIPRCWAYETAIITGVQIPDEIPENRFSPYYAPENKIHLPTLPMQNLNTIQKLTNTVEQIERNLNGINRPGVQLNIHANQPLIVNIDEVIRERKDLWEQSNFDHHMDRQE